MNWSDIILNNFISKKSEIYAAGSGLEDVFFEEEYLFSSDIKLEEENYLSSSDVIMEDFDVFPLKKKYTSLKEQKTSNWLVEDASRHSTKYQDGAKKDIAPPIIAKVYSTIENSTYEEGKLSPADRELEDILEKHGAEVLYEVMNGLWERSYASKKHSDLGHFLNCVINMSFYVETDYFLPYAISAIAHKDTFIREAGIAIVESWGDKKYKAHLENVADTGIEWLDGYKNEVIESLG